MQQKAFDQNKLYASEVLSILVQNSEVNQDRVGHGGGIDRCVLPCVAVCCRVLQCVAEQKSEVNQDRVGHGGEIDTFLHSTLVAVFCSVLPCDAVCCSVLQYRRTRWINIAWGMVAGLIRVFIAH